MQFEDFLKELQRHCGGIRAVKILQKNEIKSIAELCSHSRKDLMNFRNFGKASADAIEVTLASIDLKLDYSKEIQDKIKSQIKIFNHMTDLKRIRNNFLKQLPLAQSLNVDGYQEFHGILDTIEDLMLRIKFIFEEDHFEKLSKCLQIDADCKLKL